MSHCAELLEGRVLLAAVPTGYRDSVYASNLSRPTAMAFAPDGRLFVAQQAGQLRVVTRAGTVGSVLTTPFVTVPTQDLGERGLLGVAFDPAFPTNGYVYVYYTVNNAFNRVSRFTAVDADPDPLVYAPGNTAAAGSELVVVNLDPLSGATNHNGGAIHFGPDGKLYIAVGENATMSHSQTLANRHGKMLRINADGSIPTDNPFYNVATGANRSIYALGLRNPFTFAVQPGTGRIFVNDVGGNGTARREEVNELTAGANFGWPGIEGYRTTQPLPSIGTYKDPLYAYSGGSAITGGTFYDPPVQNFPAPLVGKYFYSDLGGAFIRYLDPAVNRPADTTSFATGISSPVDLGVGPDGALYYLARGASSVGRISYAAPRINAGGPGDDTVREGQPATFRVVAIGEGTLSYQWRRDGVNIPGATESSYTLPAATATDNGAKFSVVVTNPYGSATSREATLTVTPAVPVVVARHVFYNNSVYDGFDPGLNSDDDGAVPTDKQALMPGQRTTFSNLTSYFRGINGLMVDIANLPAGGVVAANNFRFDLSRGDGAWSPLDLAEPPPVTVRPGAGAGGSDRVSIALPDGAIANRWVRVTFYPAAGTAGPANADVFYLGNLRGDTGDLAGPDGVRFAVNALDAVRIRSALGSRAAPIDSPYDHNRDGRVNAVDRAITQRNRGHSLLLFTAPPPPVGPQPASVREQIL